MGADALEEEIHQQRGDVGPLALEEGEDAVLVDVRRHPGIDAVAGQGQGTALAVAVDEIQGGHRAVPELFRVFEFLRVRAEVFQEVVARPGGDGGHGGVGETGDAVGHLVDGAVTAAGVQAQLLAGLRQGTGQGGGVAGAVGQEGQGLDVVPLTQLLRQGLDALDAAALTGFGVDDEDMSHTRVLFSSGFHGLWTKLAAACPKALFQSIADFTEKAKRGTKFLWQHNKQNITQKLYLERGRDSDMLEKGRSRLYICRRIYRKTAQTEELLLEHAGWVGKVRAKQEKMEGKGAR